VKFLGLHCSLDHGRPSVLGVLVEVDDAGAESATEVFSHVADRHDDFALQLATLERALEAELALIGPDAVVVRARDFSPAGSRRKDTDHHGAVVGVLLATCRRFSESVSAMSGRVVAERCGTTKAAIEARGAALVGDSGKEAAAAALAAKEVGNA